MLLTNERSPVYIVRSLNNCRSYRSNFIKIGPEEVTLCERIIMTAIINKVPVAIFKSRCIHQSIESFVESYIIENESNC